MARKRGGLAGIWDRNKKIIKPLATGLAGVLGTPALGAAVGAAMGGLDREGKGGIGFDLKRGAMGGVQGYGMGKLGSALGGAAGIGKVGALERAGSTLGGSASGLKSGVMNRIGMGAAEQTAPAVSNPLMTASRSATMPVSGIGNVTLSTAPARDFMAEGAIRAAAGGARAGGMGGGLGSFLRDGKTIAAAGNALVGGMNAVNANRQMQLERDQLNRRNALEDEDRRRREGMDPVRAQLLAAMFQRLGLGGVA